MKVLVACEHTGMVRRAFHAAGCAAWSCDLKPSTDNSTEHIIGDVLNVLDQRWDLMIAHPPCTYLASSGLHWNVRDAERRAKTEDAIRFVLRLAAARIPRIAIENPVGILSTRWRKPTQIIHPWMFGHDISKATCLWLQNLPPLQPTNELPGGRSAKRSNQGRNGADNTGGGWERAARRSMTWPGIAEAMASQWGSLSSLW